MSTTEEKLRWQLNCQNWECVYCGKTIAPGDDICRCFDNHGIAHLACHSMGKAPDVSAEVDC